MKSTVTMLAIFVFVLCNKSTAADPYATLQEVKQYVDDVVDEDTYDTTGADLQASWHCAFVNPLTTPVMFPYKIWFLDDHDTTLEEDLDVSVASSGASAVWLDAEIDAFDINTNISHGAEIKVWNPSETTELIYDNEPWWDAM